MIKGKTHPTEIAMARMNPITMPPLFLRRHGASRYGRSAYAV